MPFITTPREAELNAAAHMRRVGFADAQATALGTDGGVDVVSSRAIAQVKWQASQVGRPALQRLAGARGNRDDIVTIFYTGSAYSKHAVEYADQIGMLLFTYGQDGSVHAVNQYACVLVAESKDAERSNAVAKSARSVTVRREDPIARAQKARLRQMADKQVLQDERQRQLDLRSKISHEEVQLIKRVSIDRGGLFRRWKKN